MPGSGGVLKCRRRLLKLAALVSPLREAAAALTLEEQGEEGDSVGAVPLERAWLRLNAWFN